MPRATYAIRVAGDVPTDILDDFEGVSTTGKSVDTTLRAELADTAALHGLLISLRRAGLVLLDVRRESSWDEIDSPGTGLP